MTKGQKRNKKREAIVGLEYVMKPAVRTAEEVAMALVKPEEISPDGSSRQRPQRDIYYQASIMAGKDGLIGEIAERVAQRCEVTNHPLKTVCVIDGAASLSKAVKRQFKNPVIVLDIIHVLERFWTAAHLFHKESSDEAREMVYDLLLRTLNGKIGYVIGGLKQRGTKHKLSAHKQKLLQQVLTYLNNHRDQMHYGQYLEAGYPIATGVVESACGHLVKDRMEKSGARWKIEGAEAMLR
ncbi:hypothetical protein BVY04_04505, partial [bacterium M21]